MKQLLLDAAQCLDDCLTLMMPEEFEGNQVEKAAGRFGKAGGRISRIATLADKLRYMGSQDTPIPSGNDKVLSFRKYRFYIGWMDGCNSVDGATTGVHTQDDLIPVYKSGSEAVEMFEYMAPVGFETEIGRALAFMSNFTAIDTFSIVEEV